MKKCIVCGSADNLKKIDLFGTFENIKNSHWSGEGYICEKCLEKLEICDICKKHIKSKEVTQALENANSFSFCRCDEEKKELISYEKAVHDISIEIVKKNIISYNHCLCITDEALASVLKISTYELRNILKNNRDLFFNGYFELNDNELKKVIRKLYFYKTSQNAYFFNKKGVELIAEIMSDKIKDNEFYAFILNELTQKNEFEKESKDFLGQEQDYNKENIHVIKKILWIIVCSVIFYFITESYITAFVIAGIGIFCYIPVTKQIKKLPVKNYHILGYITFCYLLYVTLISWDNKIDYGFYEFLRWLVTCFSAWSCARIYNKNPQSIWLLVFSTIAILFNPIIKIKLNQDVWRIIDIITAIIFFIYAIKNKNKKV